jgi:hypothetical protein
MMTIEQSRNLNQDLTEIKARMDHILTVLRVSFDEEDAPVFRAQEVRAAVQRLVWALDRKSHSAVGSMHPGAWPRRSAAVISS